MREIIIAFLIFCLLAPIVDYKITGKDEEIKQLKQSNTELTQECEVYRNRCLELENIIEGTGLVIDNCECR